MSALERYFVRPTTVDRVRATWLGPQIEQYVEWLAAERDARTTIPRFVTTLIEFGEFARARGARSVEDLPAHVQGFLMHRLEERGDRCHSRRRRGTLMSQARAPVEGMLRLVLSGFVDTKTRLLHPFAESVPALFEHLQVERGYRPATMIGHIHHLRAFEEFLQHRRVVALRADAGDAERIPGRERKTSRTWQHTGARGRPPRVPSLPADTAASRAIVDRRLG